MRKYILLIITLLSICLIGCSNKHTHSYGSWVTTTESSCTKVGKEARFCECGKSEVRALVLKEHSFIWVIDKEVTENENGIKHEQCSECGEIRNMNTIISNINHEHPLTFIPKIDATCFTVGSSQGVYCKICREYLEELTYIESHNIVDGKCIECSTKTRVTAPPCQVLEMEENEDGTYSIIGVGNLTSKNVTLPSVYNGKLVTRVAKGAFENSNITTLTIPTTITIIEDYSFKDCKSLESVRYMGTVKEWNLIKASIEDTIGRITKWNTGSKMTTVMCSDNLVYDDGEEWILVG